MRRSDEAPKRATNLSLSARTLDAARKRGMNLSQTVDDPLAAELRRRYWTRWNEDTRQLSGPTTSASNAKAPRSSATGRSCTASAELRTWWGLSAPSRPAN